MESKTLKSRKRPVQTRSTEMVRTILEAAARVLEGSGLDGYTTNAVAEAAGVSRAVFGYLGIFDGAVD